MAHRPGLTFLLILGLFSGIYALVHVPAPPYVPGPVAGALRCFERLRNPDFRPEGRFQSDYQLYQRLMEGAWPLKLEPASRFRVSTPEEICPGGEVLCREEGVAVAACPA